MSYLQYHMLYIRSTWVKNCDITRDNNTLFDSCLDKVKQIFVDFIDIDIVKSVRSPFVNLQLSLRQEFC